MAHRPPPINALLNGRWSRVLADKSCLHPLRETFESILLCVAILFNEGIESERVYLRLIEQ